MSSMRNAFASGYENLSAWADLLDRINVFPVADGDTGANLRISLAPLRSREADLAGSRNLLARCATGNSGNIAAAFFQEFCQAESFAELAEKAALGRAKAWQALARPQSGTMLNVFDRLAASLVGQTDPVLLYPLLCKALQETVLATTQLLPDLREAGVVDAGALGMYVFFEGFFRQLAGQATISPSITEIFSGRLTISGDFQAGPTDCFCVNALIHTSDKQAAAGEALAQLGHSVVVLPAESGFKVHIHTADRQLLRARLSALGEIVDWSDEAMDAASLPAFSGAGKRQAIHIMTDGAGSLTREMAQRHGITLLDSYILAQGQSRPESLHAPGEIYALMRGGVKVTTAQASTFERHQHYQSVCRQFGRTLYLCVGSAFTGNHDTARRWKEEHDPDNLLEVVDSGAASGRLGLVALLAARYAEQATDPEEVIRFVQKALLDCEEYVFIDELRYLAAGGRISRAGGFFADLLQMKPVISPTSEGVRKVGVVRSREGQVAFALEKLRARQGVASVIMLQHTDNEAWLVQTVQPQVQKLLPEAEIVRMPLSLTSGVHMGPGTWSLALAGREER
ncbi:MAG: DegV family EDD domain-containing protein [Proteobacteria bacterium]|jgi:DegV family protein with EDD domain|nr:DegV family EDD domain-containing protein [Pseudomonadota bacterium]